MCAKKLKKVLKQLLMNKNGNTLRAKSKSTSVVNWITFWKKFDFWPTDLRENGGLAALTELVLLFRQYFDIITILFFASLLNVNQKTTGINKLTLTTEVCQYLQNRSNGWLVSLFLSNT